MKKFLAMAAAALMLVACQPKQPVITAGEFAQKAPELVNQTILLKGTAVHVCTRSGMKLFLGDNAESEEIVNVMAQEGQNKFDPETIGKQYTVKGTVRAVKIEQEEEECEFEDSVKVSEGHDCETEAKAHQGDSDTFYYVENISYTVEK
ncbi:MAG: hypothetical protein MJZ06_07685 [Bacteroidaceae bacterium]|nr:hypothetical protein [Bacteroidaceae bacterium]